MALYLFWPAVLLVAWGELTPHPPGWTALVWDKALHFTAYFGLAGMATVALGARKRALWAILGLVLLGGALEILQGFTGRDPDIYDEVANTLGAIVGGCCGWLLVSLLQAERLLPGRDGPAAIN
ncbi:MAG: VanZ family protein [Alphaproteobacteria bacterium]|nr:VanZ family protein [Alphaproteobacteria bacterium]